MKGGAESGPCTESISFLRAILTAIGDDQMAKNERTSKAAGTAASKVLRSKTASKAAKSAAGSALTQRPDRKGSGKRK